MSGNYEPGDFLRRYQAGEREAVWSEMAALGEAVRGPPYFDDAWATARETMQRALSNVRTLVQRLDQLGYAFWNGEQGTLGPQGLMMSIGGRIVAMDSPVEQARRALAMDVSHVPGGAGLQQMIAGLLGPYQAIKAQQDARQQQRVERQAAITDHLEDPLVLGPRTADEINYLRGLETKGIVLPLSFRAWIEEVGEVNLAGAHPTLCFWEGPGFSGVYADPLMVTLDHFSFEVQSWERDFDDGESPGGFTAVVSLDPETKARLAVANDQLDEGYEIEIPNPAADAVLRLDGRQVGFVDYLRKAFQWGGFPGWAGRPDAPEAELKRLTEGLLPI